ncbi:hypothetical protein BC941DRAFT_368231 [Chlamydoabsidia padenii]|nr:hypothetical protein BC941DRAFT_368231 [Chlamydoabsidia padenii]
MTSTSPTQQHILELNGQYLDNSDLILSLETKLKQGIEELGLSQVDLAFATEYIEDHVTLFRFLKDSDFDDNLAYKRLMATILWRKELDMDKISWDTIHTSFFNHDQPAFAFFHKQDRHERPVAIIRMRHFPNFGGLALSDTIPRFACLVMEIARQWTLELTRQNDKKRNRLNRDIPILVSQIVVVIDISKSPMVPLDKRLIQELRAVTDDRFPGFFGSIYIMNFGWMYQGLWQMVKLLLSERAKSKVNFPSAQEVKQYIHEDNLLQELGGNDPYEWSLENDKILQEYGSGWKMKLPPTPISFDSINITRPSRSLSISSYSSDEFYDAPESPLVEYQHHHHLPSQSLLGMTPTGYTSIYGTPGTLTPIGVRSPSRQLSSNRSLFPPPSSATKQYFHLTGIHIPSFLASIFGSGPTFNTSSTIETSNNEGVCGVDLSYRLTNIALERRQYEDMTNDMDGVIVLEKQQRREPHFPHLLPADDPHSSSYAGAPLKMKLRRSEQRLVRITRRLFRLTFAYNGTLYWVLLYIFLRGPVEQSVHQLLTKVIKNPRTMTYTTIGVAASLAGGLGASLASSLGQ